jgi:hypothetical protein
MRSLAKQIFVKLNLSVIGILVSVSPCYPKNTPNPSPADGTITVQRVLQDALHSADEVILYSLDPKGLTYGPGEHYSPEYLATLFNRFAILGQTRIDDPGERRDLVEALCKGLANPPMVEACFLPHHGLRFRKGSQNLVDVTICFTCHQIQLNGDSPFFFISSSPQAVFDAAVQNAHLPVSAKKTPCD